MNKKDTETAVELEKLDLRSHEIAADKAAELLRLFPEIRTEGGKIDFDRLKRVLGEAADPGKERYGMNWPGKADCFKTIQQPSLATLRPCPEESVNFDTTENLIIEGDNLEVLKLLQKSYISKIKMIYIDPPYNTGNDFIYPDNYSESLQTYLEYTNQVDDQGKKFSTNTDTDGRFHSKWLNMMYPRLYLARNLLSDDGVVFISIDDNEIGNLRKLCDELFGEDNFVANYIWEARAGKDHTAVNVSVGHEYVLCYAKNLPEVKIAKDERVASDGNYEDELGRYRREQIRQWGTHDKRSDRPTMFYPVTAPDGSSVYPIKDDGSEGVWRINAERMKREIQEGNVDFVHDGKRYQLYAKKRDGKITKTAYGTILSGVGASSNGTIELKKIFKEKVFDTVKPMGLIKHLIKLASDKEAIILDFFAGSGSTANAVLEYNKHDNGSRKFLLVQLPEPCAEDSEAFKAGFKTIADIAKERVRRVIKQLANEVAAQFPNPEEKKPDFGFRVFKLADSNFKPWQAEVPTGSTESLVQQLEFHASHIREGRTPDDILYEILLKSGFPLPTQIEKIVICGKTVYSLAEGAMLICLDDALNHDLIKAIADRKPERVICLDEGFAGNDQLKTNAVQTMKARGVTSFKTV